MSVNASPSTRAYARQQGVDLDALGAATGRNTLAREDVDWHLSGETAAPATESLPRSPTPPPAPRQQAPGGINCSHALEDGLGAQPALTGRRAARRRPLARPRLPSPARNGRPVAHSARLPVAPAAQSAPNPPAPRSPTRI